MKGVIVTEQGKIRVVSDIPLPSPGDYDALVRVRSCGICNGTDLQYIDGTEKETLAPYPTVLGHESAGEVVALGKKVRYIQLGDRFIHTNLREDTGSIYTKTHGAMAEYGLVPDIRAIMEDGYTVEEVPSVTGYGTRVYTYQDGPLVNGKIGADMDLITAGVFQSLCECLAAVINFSVREGSTVLIYGCGPMGIAVMRFCKLFGAAETVAIDCVPERLAMAKTLGMADLVINFQSEDVRQILGKSLFDIVIDAVGSSKILIEGSHYCKPAGSIGAMGVLRRGDSSFDVQRLKNNTKLHMLNLPYHSFASLDILQEMIRAGKINPNSFISHIMPVDDVQKGVDLLREHKAFKVILTF